SGTGCDVARALHGPSDDPRVPNGSRAEAAVQSADLRSVVRERRPAVSGAQNPAPAVGGGPFPARQRDPLSESGVESPTQPWSSRALAGHVARPRLACVLPSPR